MTNDTCSDRLLVLVKFSHYTSFCRSTALPSLCILPVSTHRRIIHQFSLCAQILPDCLLSPCCCVYRVPYLYCKMIITIKYFSPRHCVKFRVFVFVCLCFHHCDGERWTSVCARGRLIASCNSQPRLSVSVTPERRSLVFFCFRFTISVSAGLMYSPTGPRLMLI